MAKNKTLAEVAGKMSDREAAALLGIQPQEVREFRSQNRIKRYRQPNRSAASTPEPPAPKKLLRRKAGGNGEVEEVMVDAPPPVAEAAPSTEEELPPEPEPKPAARGGRKSATTLLDQVKNKLGKVPDDAIAAEVGLSRGVVGAYRRKHKIPAYEGYLFQKGHAPLGRGAQEGVAAPKAPRPAKTAAAAPRTPPAADASRKAASTAKRPSAAKADAGRRGPKSRIEDFADLLGVETDAEVARRAGVTRAAVSAWRRNHGIVAARGPGGVPRKAEAAPAPKPAPAPAPQPVQAARPAARASGGHLAYNVISSAQDRRLEFVAVGSSVADACVRAQGWLDGRRDGPWRIDEVRYLSEAAL